jgi:spore maturation protein CgeB
LPGIPTIRIFEALACGIPLISAPWSDVEQLFPPGCYLSVNSGEAMTSALSAVLSDLELAANLSRTGLQAILSRHTCRQRVQELLQIIHGIGHVGRARGVNPQQERIAS